jgi:ABC-type amino acid transport substrate-binding protein
LSADYTKDKMRLSVNSPSDLNGKIVSVPEDTTSVAYVRKIGATAREEKDIDACYKSLLSGKSDAVVFDLPSIMHFANQADMAYKVAVVPKVCQREYYGFAMRKGNPIREVVNEAILEIIDDGTYEKIYDKWFGAK